jgi:hypothetical protein
MMQALMNHAETRHPAAWSQPDLEGGAWLRGQGFTAAQAERLVRLKDRITRGELNEAATDIQHLRLARLLVQQGRLSDWLVGQR